KRPSNSGAPYGGPPSIPGLPSSNDRRDPSMFGRGGVVGAPGTPRSADDAEQKVLVELGLEHDPNKADAERRAMRAELEKAIANLREVINEQERMLEERRVGLISQEEVIKELRIDKERMLKQIAALRAERDEAATNASRSAANLTAVEDENKRLGRLLVEIQ